MSAQHEWLCTSEGRQYFPASPRAGDISVTDIAHHLSRICRYTGAIIPEHYSVAEHSVYVSYVVPPPLAYVGLMHDWPEYVLQDVNRPLKCSLPDYKRIEELNWRAGAPVLGLPLEIPHEVHIADQMVYRAELEQVMPARPKGLSDGFDHIMPARIKIRALSPNAARDFFMRRYYELQPDNEVTIDGRLLPRLPEGPSFSTAALEEVVA